MKETILRYFSIWKITTILLSLFALYLPLNTVLKPYPVIFSQGLHPIIWSLANFDGSHYLEIALRGYMSLEYGFFPFYPMVIKLLADAYYIPYLISGILISNLCFVVALYYIVKLLEIDSNQTFATLLLAIVILFPTSYYYGAVYNDSLFLLLSTLTLLNGRKGNYMYAGFFGGLATLTRLNGLALFFFLCIEYVLQNKNRLKVLHTSTFYILIACSLIPLAFLTYLGFVHIMSGSFMNVFSSMHVWQQDKLTLPPQVVWRYLKILFLHPEMTLTYWVAVAEFTAVLWYLFILLYSWNKIRLSYWVFFALSILIPSLTGTFQGMPRYGLHIYPFFLGTTLFLQTQTKFVRTLYFMICGTLLGIFIMLFTRGYFIA